MDDKFLNSLKSEPRPGHARALRERLRQIDDAADAPRGFAWAPWLTGAGAVAALVLALSLPGVRVQAQALLDLFRVRDFAVVQVKPEQLEKLQAQKLDPSALLGGAVEKVRDPGPPQVFTNVTAAAAAAGFTPRVPSALPDGFVADTVRVEGASEARVQVDTRRLRELMDAMDVRDLTIPAGLDGRTVTMRTQPAIAQTFRKGDRVIGFVQSASPEVALPPGADLAQLGEIGLRLLGLERAEAHRMAGEIDWHGTMLVPVPAASGTFHEVTVHGVRALLIDTRDDAKAAPDDRHRPRGGNVLLWNEQGRVYAMMGRIDQVSLLQMAESVR